jgi:chitinase
MLQRRKAARGDLGRRTRLAFWRRALQAASAMSTSALFLASLALAIAPAAPAADNGRVIGAYYPGYAASRYPVDKIPADKLTHLFYAFARIDDGECVVEADAAAHFAELARLKRLHAGLHTLLSIGGWEAEGFSDAALTAASRKRFVASCLALAFDRHPGAFDGIDIDWEFPVYGGPPNLKTRPQDRRNMSALAREFRRRLDALAKRSGHAYLLTAALPAGRLQSSGAYDPAASFDLAQLARSLDFINLMTYDMGNPYSQVAAFNAPLRLDPADPLADGLKRWHSVEGGVDYYLRQGVPADKLVLGVPFFGRGYRVADDANDGLYLHYTALFDPGDWRSIKSRLLGDPAWQEHWHAIAQAPWLFNRAQRIFVSYEDPESVCLRAQFARQRGLRGVFAWEITGDDEQQSLLQAMVRVTVREPRASPAISCSKDRPRRSARLADRR